MHFLNVFIHLLRVPVKIKQSLSHNVTSNAAFIRIKSLNVFRVLLELVCVYVMDFFYLGFDDSMQCTAVYKLHLFYLTFYTSVHSVVII